MFGWFPWMSSPPLMCIRLYLIIVLLYFFLVIVNADAFKWLRSSAYVSAWRNNSENDIPIIIKLFQFFKLQSLGLHCVRPIYLSLIRYMVCRYFLAFWTQSLHFPSAFNATIWEACHLGPSYEILPAVLENLLPSCSGLESHKTLDR